MSVHRWLYISRIRIEPSRRDEGIEAILRASKVNNAASGVTGCLVMTATHVAQWLEGPFEDLRRIASAIRSDPRHEEIVTVLSGQGQERQFASWSLGHVGPSPLVSRLVMRPLRDAYQGRTGSAAGLLGAMREMAAGAGSEPRRPMFGEDRSGPSRRTG